MDVTAEPSDPTAAGREGLRVVREQAAAAQAQEDAARQRLAQARRRRAFWSRLQTQLDEDRPAAALRMLRREAPEAGEADAPLLATISALVEQAARERVVHLERDLPVALQAIGLELDASSRHPRYTLRDGFLQVVVDDAALTATVTPRDGVELVVGLDVQPLADTVRREVARLFERSLDRPAFLRCVFQAYEALCREDARSLGESLPLRRIVTRLGKDTRGFAADEFNVDLARLVQAGDTLIDGHRLVLQHTRHTKQGLLLYSMEYGGYVGFLSFQREEAPC